MAWGKLGLWASPLRVGLGLPVAVLGLGLGISLWLLLLPVVLFSLPLRHAVLPSGLLVSSRRERRSSATESCPEIRNYSRPALATSGKKLRCGLRRDKYSRAQRSSCGPRLTGKCDASARGPTRDARVARNATVRAPEGNRDRSVQPILPRRTRTFEELRRRRFAQRIPIEFRGIRARRCTQLVTRRLVPLALP